MKQPGGIRYNKRPLVLCGCLTDARFVTTTEVYPDCHRATPAQCNEAHMVTVSAAVAWLQQSVSHSA